ncbi:MAG: hypothetical protein NT014_05850, partial [Candidatus Omnitrophica bacterium]|nr:hypothetical protein [Candidatus Omnitrophota bacterium]
SRRSPVGPAKMRKIFLMVLGILFFTSLCFAQDYYALVEVLIKNDSGVAFTMNTITKVSDKETCQRVLLPIEQLKNRYTVRTGCVSGSEWDNLLKDTFANKPTSSLYISYKDPNGYETRINTKMLSGSNSPAPGSPVDPPAKEIVLWASAMIETLEKGGIKNAKIIYPAKK